MEIHSSISHLPLQSTQNLMHSPSEPRPTIKEVQAPDLDALPQQPPENDEGIIPNPWGYVNSHGMAMLGADKSERTDQIDQVLERLSPGSTRDKMAFYMLTNDTYLNLAEQLDGEGLAQLGNVTDALSTKPTYSGLPTKGPDGPQIVRFAEALAGADEEGRSRILQQADQYAAPVVRFPVSDTYDVKAIVAAISSTANDLHNYVNAVIESDDAIAMLDKMALFDDSQQATLLKLVGTGNGLGERYMDQLVARDEETQAAMLNYVGGLLEDYSPKAVKAATGQAFTGTLEYESENRLEAGNHDIDVLSKMVKDTVELMENYSFSDDQLKKMGNELSQLGRTEQRAYLAITVTGLDQLLGTDKSQPIDLSENEEAMSLVDSLRNDHSVRKLVSLSRMGEAYIKDDETFYHVKEEPIRDLQATIRILATDAWVTSQFAEAGDSPHSNRLSANLSQMDANERDDLIHRLGRMTQQDEPLSKLSVDFVQQEYQAFFDMTSTLANSNNAESLLAAESSVVSGQERNFWQATELAGKEVDKLVEILEDTPDTGAQLIQLISHLAEQVEHGSQSREQAEENSNELIRAYLQPRGSDSEKP